jgi:cytochrome c peroxidase
MKWLTTILLIALFVTTGIGWISGNKKNRTHQLKFIVPKGWPQPVYDFKQNPVTEEGFQLGRKLFYDGNLSKDGQTSCGSCHQQFAAFSTYDHDLSHGVNNTFTTRNAPALFNLAWMSAWHWDGGINHIEVQPLSPITAHNEMGETLENIILKLKNDSSYRPFFKAAFGDMAISSQRILKALAQFTGSLISANSRYDQWKKGEIKFTVVEEAGYAIYKINCSSCHKEPLFTDNDFRNNGLSLNRFSDVGRQKITGLSSDSLKFKVPSLRNVQYSVPYMHDGRFNDLDKVITHYTSGINSLQPTLDSILRKPIIINEKEKQQLIYFLYTLTDTSFTKNKRFAPAQQITYKH